MTRLARAPLHQDELCVGHAADPETSIVRDEARAFRGFDRLVADEVPNRRQAELRDEVFLADDVALVKASDLDLEPALAERLADQVRVRRRDEGLFPLVIHLHADGHRPGPGYNRSTSLYLFFAGL